MWDLGTHGDRRQSWRNALPLKPKGRHRASQSKERDPRDPRGMLPEGCIWKGDNKALFPLVQKFLDPRRLPQCPLKTWRATVCQHIPPGFQPFWCGLHIPPAWESPTVGVQVRGALAWPWGSPPPRDSKGLESYASVSNFILKTYFKRRIELLKFSIKKYKEPSILSCSVGINKLISSLRFKKKSLEHVGLSVGSL